MSMPEPNKHLKWRNFAYLVLILLIVLAILFTKVNPYQSHNAKQYYPEQAIYQKLAQLTSNKADKIQWFNLTKDRGVRILQITPNYLSSCSQVFFIMQISQGSELTALFEHKMNAKQLTTVYLYKNEGYQSFPDFNFWYHSFLSKLEYKMQSLLAMAHLSELSSSNNSAFIEPVIALGVPTTCHYADLALWQQLDLTEVQHYE
ncbi:hypothetical protein HR060_04780 [Catenovulum sp. SM1970]|uniref:hypothetical protein n=1 Tax=Marinifaba aquimaris TaxID=2741323 RepID=UPI00157476D5|nr:hypothetical protein [Marinifaba aquimaris]NTS76177.1 hypothetical protein [Marinifaba aquimaris]